MKKHVIVILEYDLGDYADWEEETGKPLSTNPKDWEDSFYQSDVYIHDMDMVGIRIEEKGEKNGTK